MNALYGSVTIETESGASRLRFMISTMARSANTPLTRLLLHILLLQSLELFFFFNLFSCPELDFFTSFDTVCDDTVVLMLFKKG